MSTAPKKPAAKIEEIAGKTWAEVIDLAARYGYGVPIFATRCDGIWVLRFEVKS